MNILFAQDEMFGELIIRKWSWFYGCATNNFDLSHNVPIIFNGFYF